MDIEDPYTPHALFRILEDQSPGLLLGNVACKSRNRKTRIQELILG
jgi:hypothetical protein